LGEISLFRVDRFVVLIGCGENNGNSSNLKEAWNSQNDPIKMNPTRDYTVNFDMLPLEAVLSVQPWSGDYWPTIKVA
jgi:hypothetical protein